MYTSVELLDMVKARYDLPSDYAAAKKLCLTRSYVSKIRRAECFFGVDSCLIISELLDMKPMKVIGSIQLERGQNSYNPRAKELWQHYAA